MRSTFWQVALMVLLGLGRSAAEEARLGWFSVSAAPSAPASETFAALHSELEKAGLAVLSQEDVLKRMRRVDEEARVVERAAASMAEGKKLHLGMELEKAAAKYREAIDLLQGGWVRYYEPGLLAEPWLQLGVALIESGKREEAEGAFRRAAQLVPGLQISGGYFSPRVRETFERVTAGLGPEAEEILTPAEAARLSGAIGLLGLLVLAENRLGQLSTVQVGLFDSVTQSYRQLESAVLEEPRETGRQLANRLLATAAQVAGMELGPSEPAEAADAGAPTADDAGVAEDGDAAFSGAAYLPSGADGGEGAIPPPPPWYLRHWWIWPVAAALVGTAIALPLTVFRHEVVDIYVH